MFAVQYWSVVGVVRVAADRTIIRIDGQRLVLGVMSC